MATPTSTRSVVIRARNIILRYGWVRLEPGNVHKGFCIASAVRHAFIGEFPGEWPPPLTGEELDLLAHTIELLDLAVQPLCGRENVVWWNDHCAQSKQQVIVFLNSVIEALRPAITV